MKNETPGEAAWNKKVNLYKVKKIVESCDGLRCSKCDFSRRIGKEEYKCRIGNPSLNWDIEKEEYDDGKDSEV